ncbi:hypothetical protein [Kitasatospora sp. NPDC059462]|uniref:hypothetical protein n=1 Tax=Kitasatospora sp. NPDC059462 TaxID=3346841 RepID=UPI003679EFAC
MRTWLYRIAANACLSALEGRRRRPLYRLLTFPTVLGTGRRLFPAEGPRADLECVMAERTGPAVLTHDRRAA